MGFLASTLVNFEINFKEALNEPEKEEQFIIESSILNFGGPFGPLPSELYEDIVRNFREGRKEQLEFLNLFVDRLVKLDFHFKQGLDWRFGNNGALGNPSVTFINKFLDKSAHVKSTESKSSGKLNLKYLRTFSPRRNMSAVHLKKILLVARIK